MVESTTIETDVRLSTAESYVLTLHGQQGSDVYDIGLAGGISSRINVFDQSRGDSSDRLRVFGMDQADFFLFRANKDIGQGMVAAIQVMRIGFR